MIGEVKAGPYTVRGISVGGVYTSIHVPELDVLFDVGVPLRSAAAVGTLLLSHGHADHVGALGSLLGIRALHGIKRPLRVVMPREIVDDVVASLRAQESLQRWPLAIEPIGLVAGEEVAVRKDLIARAFRTFHPVPSLGFQLLRRVTKLRPEFHGLPGPEIARRRHAGEDLTEVVEQRELAYATDTLVQVVDHEPSILDSRVLVIECTFLDERKPIEAARAGCHVHLDELLERADRIANAHVVVMHVSQLYRPDEIAELLDRRVPAGLRARVQVLLPGAGDWFG